MDNTSRNIIWLASYPKSGNTWFRIFLENLLSVDSEPVSINELHHTFSASSRELFDKYLGNNSSDLTLEEINFFRPEIYRIMSEEYEKQIYMKVHDAWRTNDAGDPIFQKKVTKLVLYFIRNPLEIAVSFAHHSHIRIPSTIEQMNDDTFGLCIKKNLLFNQLPQELMSWSEHVRSWTERSNLPFLVIRYEDMLSNPFKTFSKALISLDLKYSDKAINRAISNSNIKQLQKQENENGFKEKTLSSKSFFRSGSNDTWKTKLTKPEIREIIQHHGSIMEQYGYVPAMK